MESTFCDQTASTVNSSGMELHEFKVLERQPGPGYHCVAISRASVGTCATKISSTITTGSKNCFMGTETV